MALYEYVDDARHVQTHLRTFARKNDPVVCATCGAAMRAIEISATHVEPDGMYSYAPNIGNADQFERRQIALKNGDKVIKKEG